MQFFQEVFFLLSHTIYCSYKDNKTEKVIAFFLILISFSVEDLTRLYLLQTSKHHSLLLDI